MALRRQKNIVILIKPASGRCNMHCSYCFYADETKSRSFKDCGMMSQSTAHLIVDKALDYADSILFSFQGGEPTLQGPAFFRDFSEYAKMKSAERVSFAIQTNGYDISREWLSIFTEYDYLVGLSLDGNKVIHDKYRTNAIGKGSFRKVFSTAQLFRSNGIKFNILTTVNKEVAENIEEIYAFFKRNDFIYQQYIPCIDPMQTERGTLPYSLTSRLYGEFLIRLFELYYSDWINGQYISIRYFDNLVRMLCGEQPTECSLLGCCPMNFIIEGDGSVYPCDFYVIDGYQVGDIHNNSFYEMANNLTHLNFIEKSKNFNSECSACRFYPLCRGGCRRDREDFRTGELNKSYLCLSYKMFFDACIEKLAFMAEKEQIAINRIGH